MNKKYLFLICIGIGLLGCKNTNEPSVMPASHFVDATTRIYSQVLFNANGQQIGSSTDTVSIISSSVYDGSKQITFSDGTRATLSGSDSAWILTEFNPNTSFCSLSKFPAKPGDTLLKVRFIPVQIGDVNGPANVTTVVTENGKKVTVTPGTYDCSVYEFNMAMSYLPMRSKVVTCVSATAGVVCREYYQTDPISGDLYLYSREELLELVGH
jgi:hypothetical protein